MNAEEAGLGRHVSPMARIGTRTARADRPSKVR